MEFDEPFLLVVDVDPDFNAEDLAFASSMARLGNDAIASDLVGDSHPLETLDVLESCGVDVDSYVDSVVHNVGVAMRQGVTVEGVPSVLFLPE